MKFSPEETAVICVLMLRGAQTIGEIKGRTGRMSNFESLLQVEEVINKLSIREKPLVMKLSRQAGMKELRYAHLLSCEPVYQSEPEPLENEIEEDKRLLKLEQELSVLHADLDQLKTQFNELKKLLE
jgi:uncharacterized protein YceH (UPF0502 family)